MPPNFGRRSLLDIKTQEKDFTLGDNERLTKSEIGVSRSHPDYQKLYYKKNREKLNAYHREYSKRNRDKRRLLEHSWRKRNPNRVKEINARGSAKWAKENRGNKNFWSALRRASIRRATPPWANLEKIKLIYLEASHLTDVTGIKHEVDHIYPLRGDYICGLHVENNLQVIVQENNRRKHNYCDYWWLANFQA